MRLAEEHDAARDRGEGATGNRTKDFGVADYDAKPATAADLGLRRDEIQEARRLRAAEAVDPGLIGRTIQAKAARRRANERIAYADRALATQWAIRTITEGNLIAFFAIVERAGKKAPALTPCAGAGAGEKANGLGSNPHRLQAERGGNEAGRSEGKTPGARRRDRGRQERGLWHPVSDHSPQDAERKARG